MPRSSRSDVLMRTLSHLRLAFVRPRGGWLRGVELVGEQPDTDGIGVRAVVFEQRVVIARDEEGSRRARDERRLAEIFGQGRAAGCPHAEVVPGFGALRHRQLARGLTGSGPM